LKITLKPAGIIRRYATEADIEVESGLSSRVLIRRLGIPEKLKMVALVNGKRRGLDEDLQDGDEVRLITLLTGG
jgi:molybdopterin converting factor small subunit